MAAAWEQTAAGFDRDCAAAAIGGAIASTATDAIKSMLVQSAHWCS
jgi:hypothetical protein